MREFFKFVIRFFQGRKRRVGALTLMLALVLVGGWVRSFVIPEHIYFLCDGDNSNRLVSSKGSIDWERFHQEVANRLSGVQFTTARLVVEKDESRILAWKWNLLGCGRGEYQSEVLNELKSSNPLLPFENITQSVWRIPYWSVVIPLTLLSAFLLLSRPRKSNQTKPPGTVVVEGT